MSGLLDGLLGFVSPWGYVVVTLLAGLEAAAFVGLVIPGETAMLLGGVLAFTGRASLLAMMACAAVGAIVGDSVGYELGRRFGGPLRRSRLARRVGDERWDRTEEYVRRRGGRAVFLGRFVGLLRAMVPFVAGASRMPYRTFLPYNALGAVIWAPGFVSLGFLAGHSYQRVERLAGRAGLLLAAGVVLLATVALAARWVIHHPDRVLAPTHRLRARPAIARLEHRYARRLHFLADRLRPRRPAGLVLAVGLAARCSRRTWAPMAFLAVTLGGAILTSTVIKLLVARPRPTSGALVRALGYAFPSGHSTAATAGWFAVAVVLGWLARSLTVRVSVLAAALLVAVMVGVSRVYLGVHAPTDVLAGWAVGGLWVTGVLTVTHLLTLREATPRRSAADLVFVLPRLDSNQ